MIVTTGSEINPDHNFDYNRAIAKVEVEVANLAEAQAVCREFIETTGIGGGNWSGGDIWEDGVKIAVISYNCRVWTPEDNWQRRTILLENK